MDYSQRALDEHKLLKGKISVELKAGLNTKDNLSTFYSPGVGAVSKHLAENPGDVRDYTWTGNTVAVISDGSAVLGLGNIGPIASLPVMEGKCMLFKHFGGIDAVPVILDVHTADEIVAVVKAIAPTYGGINLEDIAAPLCFEVEERLKAELNIPVFHDDQHGTAVVVLAGLINSMKVTGKDLNNCSVVVNGVGAAGVAIIKLIKKYSPGSKVLAVDSKGIIWTGRDDLNETKKYLIDENLIFAEDGGDLAKALIKADVFIGVSQADLLTPEMVEAMKDNPIVFALANPNPEISAENATKTKITILATGRSDYPNQVNNAVAFPGIFRGALDNKVSRITDEHKIATAEAIASLVESPTANEIIPSVLDDRLVPTIAKVIV
jgi:malate dehydrogenase (oxaloacetate-decarboxylating)